MMRTRAQSQNSLGPLLTEYRFDILFFFSFDTLMTVFTR